MGRALNAVAEARAEEYRQRALMVAQQKKDQQSFTLTRGEAAMIQSDRYVKKQSARVANEAEKVTKIQKDK